MVVVHDGFLLLRSHLERLLLAEAAVEGAGCIHTRVASAPPLSGLGLQSSHVLLIALDLRYAAALDHCWNWMLRILNMCVLVRRIHLLILQLRRDCQVARAASDQPCPVVGGAEAVLLLLQLLQRSVSTGLIEAAAQTRTHRAGRVGVHELSRLLRVAYCAPIGVLPLLVQYEVAITVLQLRQLAVLVRNVNVVLHVLVLQRELTVAAEVGRLHWLGQIQRDKLV